jgi:hypothetical protein
LGNGAFNGYLLLFGFILLVIGVLAAASSIGMLSNYSDLSGASIMLFVGALVALVGTVLVLMSFLSSKRGLRMLY